MEFSTSVTDKALLQHRQKVRAVSLGDVACVLNRYFGKDKVVGIAVMGPDRQKLDGGWKVEKLLCIIKKTYIFIVHAAMLVCINSLIASQ